MVTRKHRARDSNGPIRIGDVAAAAGVSTATVSRTLSHPDKVRPDTRDRVMSAVNKLGYTRNAAARNLRAGTSMLVLVVVPNMANLVFVDLIRGVDERLSEHGYGIIIGDLHNVVEKERHLVDLVFSGYLDGAVVASGRIPSFGGRSILEANIPIVATNCAVDDERIPCVLLDDRQTCARITQHLLDLGHRNLMFISGPPGHYNDVGRYAGFLATVEKAGLRPDQVTRFEGDYTFTAGAAAALEFLAGDRRVTGVVASNDEQAVGFIHTVSAAGVRVPEDVSVVGIDGIEVSLYTDPALTTMEQPLREMGRLAAETLLKAFAGTPLTKADGRVLQAELLVRSSTGPVVVPSLQALSVG